MKLKQTVAVSALLASFSGFAHAEGPAFTYYADQFKIDKVVSGAWSNVFNDNFDSASNTLAPALVNPYGGSYGVYGSFATDSLNGSGKVRLDNAGAALATNAAGEPIYVQQAKVNTSTNNSDLNGLKRNTTFAVTAVFDLSKPALGGGYGIRLGDSTASNQGNDLVNLLVRNTSSGYSINFSKSNFDTGTISAIDSAAITGDSPFIALRFYHDNSLVGGVANQLVTASFAYLSSANDLASASWTTFGNTTDIFNGEEWTQASFRGLQYPVPEADTWAMMVVGVGLIGFQLSRRRKKSAPLALN